MKKIIGLTIFSFWVTLIYPQSFAINIDGSIAHSSAILDVKSDTKGVLITRVSKAQKNAIATPAIGLLVYQISPDSIGFHYYTGTQWLWLEALENKVWKTNGNSGTDTAINFIGTTDNMPLRFKQNNTLLANWNKNNSSFFIGEDAGKKNGIANSNIGIGKHALTSNVLGSPNIALGDSSLAKNLFGSDNVAIGFHAGKNMTSNGSVFIGSNAGSKTTSAFNNFIGSNSAIGNTSGSNNNFMGYRSGENNTSGRGNTVIGDIAMNFIKTGSENTLLGYRSNVGDNFIDSAFINATAIGALALVDTSNALVLGSINGINGATANTNVAIGITKPISALHVSRGNSGSVITNSNRIVTFEDNSSNYIQLLSPNADETGILAGNAATLIKSGIIFTNDSSMLLKTGGNNTRIVIQDTGNIGIGNNFPTSKLTVNGSLSLPIRIITSSATATITAADHTLIINNSIVGSIPIVLPLVTTTQGREYIFVNQNSFTHSTNFAYRDFTNTPTNSIPPNTSITLQGSGAFWYRVR